MRKLSLHDAFAVAKILKKADAKDEISRIMSLAAELNGTMPRGEIQQRIGIEAISTILIKCANEGIEKDFYSVIADVSENKTAEEIEYLPFEEIMDLFKEIASRNNLASFFKSAVNSMK